MLTGGKPVSYTSTNAAHNESPWEDSFHIADEDCNSKDIFKKITFTKNLGLVHTHTYPEFEYMNRLPNTKIIIIKIDKKDHDEVVHNWVIKNNDPLHLLDSIKMGIDYFSENDRPDIDITQMYKYCNPYVPKDFTNATLIINYSDLYKPTDNSYVALEQLEQFLGKEANASIIENYKEYVDNRNKIWNK